MKNLILKMKSSFLFLFLVLPFFSFGGSVKVFSFSANHSTSNVLSFIQIAPENFAVPFYNNTFGFVVQGYGAASAAKSLRVPSYASSSVTNRYGDISHPVSFEEGTPSNLTVWESVSSSPSLKSLFDFALSVTVSGYSGPGLHDLGGNSITRYFNFDYKSVVSDILCSTNATYRQIVLNHLSQIQSAVINIDSGVSALVPSVDRIADINSLIASNTFDSATSLRSIETNSLSSVNFLSGISDSVSSLSTNSVDILRGVDLLHDDWFASSIDVFLGDDTDSWVNFLNISVEQGLLSEYDASQYASTLRATDPTRKKSYSIPDAHRRFFAKKSIKSTVIEAQQMRGRYQTFRNWVNQRGEDFAAMDFTWNAVAGDRINSIVSSHVDDWRYELRQQLQDWKTSDEHGILNIKKTIEDNFMSNDPRIPGYSNTVPFTAFVTNYVTAPITNVVSDSARGISSNVVDQSKKTRELFNEKLFDPNSPGVNVRVVYPIDGQDVLAVSVHDTALDGFGATFGDLTDTIKDFNGDVNDQWEAWFRRWDSWSPSVSDNIEAIVDILRHWSNGVSRLDHELYKDYSNYVHSSSYAMLFDELASDYPVCYSNLQKFGLSPSSNDGRWWNVVASTLAYDTAMLSYIFEDMVELDRIAHDSLSKSPFSFLRSTLSDMPSKSQIEDYVSHASNATFQVEYALSSLSNAVASVSNSYVSVFNPFRGHFDTPGASVTFFKIHDGHDGQYVTIPVGDQADAWRYIRLGVSFGLVAVNILLFPKYLLMLFTLFIKAYRIGIKFFPDDR